MNSAYNYGAQLQAYALLKTVESLGSECNIIDRRSVIEKNVKLSASPYDIAAFLHKKDLNAGYRAFERFDVERHNLTSENFREYSRLKENPPEADVYITGSDQVWNPLGFDPAYFLDFVPAGKKKISYAASIGVSNIPEDKKSIYKDLLMGFDAVSVREEKAKEILEEFVPKDIKVHCDPVFLLSKDKWREIEQPVRGVDKPYILCYILYRPKWLNGVIKNIKKQTGKQIVLVDPTGWRNIYHDKYIRFAGPAEFIWLISHCDGVITSSFHGTAFASVFSKPFASVINPQKPARITNILQKLELTEHILTEKNTLRADAFLSDFSCEEKIHELVSDAILYLKKEIVT